MRHPISHFSLICGLGLVIGCGPGAQPRPNVVLITLDTVRADFVSCYGQAGGRAGGLPGGTTPQLDRLAAAGARFAEAHSASGVTPVSHATILTGTFPPTHGLRVLSGDGGAHLSESVPTLATRMKDAGYRTIAVHSAFPVSSVFGFDHGFDVFDSLEGELAIDPARGKVRWDTNRFQRRSDETTARVMQALEAVDEPWFLWIHYWDPHDPILQPPPEALAGMPNAGRTEGPLSQAYTNFYAREIAFQDEQIGHLLEAVGAYGDGGPLVAVTADHGEGLIDGYRRHGWSKHRMTYREQLWVPLLLGGPGVPKGKVVDAQVRTADLAPTLLDYAGIAATPSEFDGISLRPWLEGARTDELVVYADQINAYDFNAGMVESQPNSAFLFTLSDGRWKYIYRPHATAASELFDLRSDPLEEHNVAAEHPGEAQRLLAELGRMRPWVTRPYEQPGNEESNAALGGLGYLPGRSASGLVWTWSCPLHPDVSLERPGRCQTEDCDQECVPSTDWSQRH